MASQCRACLNTNSMEFVPLGAFFTEEHTYIDFFNKCTKLEVTLDDGFPQEFCQGCANILILIYNFIKTAQKSDENLQSYLSKNAAIANEQNLETLEETGGDNMQMVVEQDSMNATIETDEENWTISEDCEHELSPGHNLEFICEICNIFFEVHTQLEQHILDEHSQAENAGFICETCNQIFESYEILNLHKIIFHQPSNSSCTLCGKTDFKEDITEHISAAHPVEYAKLFRIIDETSNIAEDLLVEDCRTDDDGTESEELDVDNPAMNVEPTLRNENFEENNTNTETDLKQETPLLCNICQRIFKNQKSLRQHEKIHLEAAENGLYICTDCNRQYNTSALLEQHRKNAHKQREYACKICGNSFKLKNQLNNHMKLHLEKNIACPHCDKKYARKFDFNVHLRTHTGETPFECHLCDKKFAIKVRLTYHLQKHYGIKHSCKECGAFFNSKSKLKAHSYKHTGMPYKCEACQDHGFPNRDVFKRHLLRVHNATISEEDLQAMFKRNTGKTTRIREVN